MSAFCFELFVHEEVIGSILDGYLIGTRFISIRELTFLITELTCGRFSETWRVHIDRWHAPVGHVCHRVVQLWLMLDCAESGRVL